MSELERRLRDAAQSESAAYQPSADLPGRIDHRVRLRRRRTQALAGGGALAAAAIFALVVTQLPGDDQQGVVADDSSSTTTTSTDPRTTSTTASTSTDDHAHDDRDSAPAGARCEHPAEPQGRRPDRGRHDRGAGGGGERPHAHGPGRRRLFGGYCFYVELEGHPDLTHQGRQPRRPTR